MYRVVWRRCTVWGCINCSRGVELLSWFMWWVMVLLFIVRFDSLVGIEIGVHIFCTGRGGVASIGQRGLLVVGIYSFSIVDNISSPPLYNICYCLRFIFYIL